MKCSLEPALDTIIRRPEMPGDRRHARSTARPPPPIHDSAPRDHPSIHLTIGHPRPITPPTLLLLHRVLVHACYAEARRKPDWVDLDRVPWGRDPPATEAFGSVLERDRLERAFQRLSLDHRAVIVLRYLLDMTPERVGETLGIPRRIVYSRLKRAMPAMRAALEADTRPVPAGTTSEEVIR